jgi:hypothetical protein
MGAIQAFRDVFTDCKVPVRTFVTFPVLTGVQLPSE